MALTKSGTFLSDDFINQMQYNRKKQLYLFWLKSLIVFLFCAIATELFGIGFYYCNYGTKIEPQLQKQYDNARKLNEQIIALTKIRKKAAKNNIPVFTFLDGLAKNRPKDVYLTSIFLDANRLSCAGLASNVANLSIFVDTIALQKYKKPILESLDTNSRKFTIVGGKGGK